MYVRNKTNHILGRSKWSGEESKFLNHLSLTFFTCAGTYSELSWGEKNPYLHIIHNV